MFVLMSYKTNCHFTIDNDVYESFRNNVKGSKSQVIQNLMLKYVKGIEGNPAKNRPSIPGNSPRNIIRSSNESL